MPARFITYLPKTISLLLGLTTATLAQKPVVSRLEIYDLATNSRRVVRQDSVRFEAPNWTRDGRLIINQEGLLYGVRISDGQKTKINTGSATNCNNDHGLTFDGQTLIISNNVRKASGKGSTSTILTLPLAGGQPKQLTDTTAGHSYWHGVSPDGKTLVFTGERSTGEAGKTNFDIYAIPRTGGPETRLTNSPSLDDGPEYSPDGKSVYFNSVRSGRMQIWRMNADGSQPKQLTDDAYSNWFAHPSPDGQWFVFISYLEDQGSNHPADKAVMLRLMNVKTGQLRELARFTGGQGTINVPSWSPDSKSFAFVSY
ncbi:TolB family protein [Spirosoma rhododendri]|uniref:TolB family protein n=1 Tax=Spirosoma rhododendri TaxID=2728024 RepID=A0A7L5DU78_9BACT|nr:PD40 domain-containing protein [Spirosoma rhododendri]QJD80873.1 TolB family protein [Spirosoma rhododendri]